MKLLIQTKTRMRERGSGGRMVTRYGCHILQPNAAQSDESKESNVTITMIGEDLGEKDVDGTIELA